MAWTRNQLWSRVRTHRSALALGAAIALSAAPALSEDRDVADEIRAMRETVLQLQEQLRGQQAELAEQETALRGAGLEERSSGSPLSSFLEKTDFSGTIASSYAYNPHANGGSSGGGQNTVGAMNPFHPDHNSIQLDEVWLRMARSTSDESPVGFGIDIAYGQLGEALGNTGVGGGNSFWLPQAYLEYAMHGLTWTVGKFDTHIGYETPGAANNVNITRGFTFAAMQPISQIGAKLSGDFRDLSWMIGVVNGIAPNQFDVDGMKDLIWQLGWSSDTLALLFNGQYGGDAEAFGGGPKDHALILDAILEWRPNDRSVSWVELTYNRVKVDRQGANGSALLGTDLKDTKAIALVLGTRQALTDRLGIGTRIEWAKLKDDQKAVFGSGAHSLNIAGGFAPVHAELVSATATVDYLIVEGLTFKTELQIQKLLGARGIFGTPTTTQIFDDGKQSHTVLLLAQLIYAF